MERERAKAMYRVSPYFIAKTTGDFTTTIILPSLYATICYWVAGMKAEPGAFFIYLSTFMLCLLTAESLGLAISAAIQNIKVALMIAPLITLMLMILGGFYVQYDNIPLAFRWISYVSFARYAFTSMVINEFRGSTFACDDQYVQVHPNAECPLTGEQVIASLSMDGYSVGRHVPSWLCMEWSPVIQFTQFLFDLVGMVKHGHPLWDADTLPTNCVYFHSCEYETMIP